MYTLNLREVIHHKALIYPVPTVAAGGGHILNIDFVLLQICATGQRAARAKTNTLLTKMKEEEENKELRSFGRYAGQTGGAKCNSSAGKESGKESADSAKPQSDGALKAVMIRRS